MKSTLKVMPAQQAQTYPSALWLVNLSLTNQLIFTILGSNTPAKPRLTSVSTLKSRGFFYAWSLWT